MKICFYSTVSGMLMSREEVLSGILELDLLREVSLFTGGGFF